MAALTLTLYDHCQELAELVMLCDQAEGSEREQLELQIREQLLGTKQKIDRVAGALSNLEAIEQACKEEASRLTKRAGEAYRAKARLKEYVVQCMAAAGTKRMEGLRSGFTVRENAPAVEILDESAIPAQYVRVEQTTSPDRRAIKDAINAGEFVPGARLVQTLSLLRR